MSRVGICAAWFVSAGVAAAHDSFLLPDAFRANMGQEVRVAFFSTDEFPLRESATAADRVRLWRTLDVRGGALIEKFGVEDKDLAARVRFERAAVHTVAIELKPKLITMPVAKFERYLRDENAGRLLTDESFKSGEDQVEQYTKFAKTYISVGVTDDSPAPPVVGHRLEIVPLSNPTRLTLGSGLGVRILREGRPESNVRVSSGRADLGPHTYVEHKTTDGSGQLFFTFDRYGVWFLRAWVIRRAGDRDADHAWESDWATISFEVRDPRAGTSAAGAGDDVDRLLSNVADVHGGAGPWAVLGYRIGHRALKELDLPRGSFDLEVIHETPKKVQFACIADGVQAATGATPGKLNLQLREIESDDVRTTFRHKKTGRTVVIRPADGFRTKMFGIPYEKLTAKGREAALMPDDELMVVSVK